MREYQYYVIYTVVYYNGKSVYTIGFDTMRDAVLFKNRKRREFAQAKSCFFIVDFDIKILDKIDYYSEQGILL